MTVDNEAEKWESNQPSTKVWLAIAGLVILFICGVSSLIYSMNQYFNGSNEENNALATKVERDKRSMQADLSTQAAATATAAVAEQIEIRNLAVQWPVSIFDPFDENIYEWWVDDIDDEYTTMKLTMDGRYIWDATAKQGFIWRIWPETDSAADFYLAVDAQNLTETQESYYGLIFRNNDGRYYLFEVWDSQYYSVHFYDGREWMELIPYSFSPEINPDGVNHLEVVSKEDIFYFFINSAYVGQIEGAIPEEGQVGLAIGLSNADTQVTVAFDNFEYRIP